MGKRVSTFEEQDNLASRFNAQVTSVNGYFKRVPDLHGASEYIAVKRWVGTAGKLRAGSSSSFAAQ